MTVKKLLTAWLVAASMTMAAACSTAAIPQPCADLMQEHGLPGPIVETIQQPHGLGLPGRLTLRITLRTGASGRPAPRHWNSGNTAIPLWSPRQPEHHQIRLLHQEHPNHYNHRGTVTPDMTSLSHFWRNVLLLIIGAATATMFGVFVAYPELLSKPRENAAKIAALEKNVERLLEAHPLAHEAVETNKETNTE